MFPVLRDLRVALPDLQVLRAVRADCEARVANGQEAMKLALQRQLAELTGECSADWWPLDGRLMAA